MDYIKHHGILGQKWGVRRFQNADGSLTSAGKNRYKANQEQAKEAYKSTKDELGKANRNAVGKSFTNLLNTNTQRQNRADAQIERNALRVQKLQDKHTYKISKMKQKDESEEKINDKIKQFEKKEAKKEKWLRAVNQGWTDYAAATKADNAFFGAFDKRVSTLKASGYTQKGAEYVAAFLPMSSYLIAKGKAYKTAGKEFDEKNK